MIAVLRLFLSLASGGDIRSYSSPKGLKRLGWLLLRPLIWISVLVGVLGFEAIQQIGDDLRQLLDLIY